MNKWLSATFFLFILFSLCACGKPAGDSPGETIGGIYESGGLDAETPQSIIPKVISAGGTKDEIEPLPDSSATPSSIPYPIEPTAPPPISINDSGSATIDAPVPATPPGNGQMPAPGIAFFRSDVEEANPGDSITLEWSTSDAITVTLWHMIPTGQLGRRWDVSPAGSFDYTIGLHEKNATWFTLFATGSEDHSEMASATISLRCQDGWFFEHAPEICPAAPASSSAAAVQHFERGIMIWVEEEGQIYILYDDVNSPGWNRYVDQWNATELEMDPAMTPPDGLFQPIRGFGLVWREESGVRDRLGWAIEQESGFETIVQRTSYAKYNETYILASDGEIWRLHPERSAWEKMAAPASQ
jgi:hypothetical protein